MKDCLINYFSFYLEKQKDFLLFYPGLIKMYLYLR